MKYIYADSIVDITIQAHLSVNGKDNDYGNNGRRGGTMDMKCSSDDCFGPDNSGTPPPLMASPLRMADPAPSPLSVPLSLPLPPPIPITLSLMLAKTVFDAIFQNHCIGAVVDRMVRAFKNLICPANINLIVATSSKLLQNLLSYLSFPVALALFCIDRTRISEME